MKNEFTFFSNLLNIKNQIEFKISQGNPITDSFYKPQFLEFSNSITGSLIAIDIFPGAFLCKTGIIKARRQFLQALKYSVDNLDVRIVLLAASTKRLFGKEIELRVNWDGLLDDMGFTLQELYPHILFTNGDNGTAAILNMEIDSILKKAEIITGKNIVIINGLGLLGLDSLEYLLGKNLTDEQIIIISNHTMDLKELIGDRNISVFPNIKSIKIEDNDKIRSIINCTHNPSSLITADNLQFIQNGQSIHVIDVAVPYGFPEDEYKKCKNVFRQDGGNAYIENGLEFFFNPEICGLTEKIIYGCFAETIALSAYLKENPEELDYIRCFDYFNVNKKTKDFVKSLFQKYGIGNAPEPFNFNKLVVQSSLIE
ncbi:MAG: hypothetical protein HW421_2535 [Ignavibacteria bacterium]|nr:hypothetical protein [Ignavibacteria bacterium]